MYKKILDEVCLGKPSKETLDLLSKRVMNESVTETFQKLNKAGSSPVCLFPTCKVCEDHNREMLTALDAKIETISCIDEIDETSSTRKWTKDVAAQLKKLNKDCNLTSGLEAKLAIAVGARVMLCRNIDTKRGLVNGSIGTVTAITSQCITVKFDHIGTVTAITSQLITVKFDRIDEPCPIERVRSKFMVKKTFYVYHK